MTEPSRRTYEWEINDIPAWAGLALIIVPITFWSLVGYGVYRIVRKVRAK
jgi:hypothetical protein